MSHAFVLVALGEHGVVSAKCTCAGWSAAWDYDEVVRLGIQDRDEAEERLRDAWAFHEQQRRPRETPDAAFY